MGSSGRSSELSPTPSPSVSVVSVGSSGRSSELSPTPSPSVSSHSAGSPGKASALSPTPSPSVSTHSLGSPGKASELSPIPSLSVSFHSLGLYTNWSRSSLTPSPSESLTNPLRAQGTVVFGNCPSLKTGEWLPPLILHSATLLPSEQLRCSSVSVSFAPAGVTKSRFPVCV